MVHLLLLPSNCPVVALLVLCCYLAGAGCEKLTAIDKLLSATAIAVQIIGLQASAIWGQARSSAAASSSSNISSRRAGGNHCRACGMRGRRRHRNRGQQQRQQQWGHLARRMH